MTFTRIAIDPAVCTGKHCIRGLRFPVARLLDLAAGESREQILKDDPYLEAADIDEALGHAAELAEDGRAGAVKFRSWVRNWRFADAPTVFTASSAFRRP